jgi:hypothetical protein
MNNKEPLIDRLAAVLLELRSITQPYKPDDEDMWELARIDLLVEKILQEYDEFSDMK